MTQESKKVAAKPVAKAAADDLSEQIRLSMERQPDEEVRCVRVFDDHYRCNWWVRERVASNWMACATGTIRKSRFLRVVKVAEELVIEDLSNRG